jgi:Ca-activated chloride channel family protein
VFILITDGEDHDEDARTIAAAEQAAQSGMKIFTLGVGSADGDILQVKDSNGNYVKSRLNETLLQKIATIGNGFYLPLRGANPIETLYSRGLAPLPKSDASTKMSRVYRERFQWPLALSIICLAAEMFVPERKRIRGATPPSPRSAAAGRAAAVACVLLTPLIAMGSPSGALREYNSGNYELAQKEYERLAEQKTNDYRLNFNAGTAAYQAKQYDAAEKHFNETLNSPEVVSDPRAQEHALFNLGNTQYKQGPDKWGHAVTNFTRALRLDPRDTNAEYNLKYVQRKIEELKKQQQQQQDKQNQDKQDKQQGQQQDQKQQKGDQKDQKDQQAKQQQQNQQGKKDDQQQQAQQKQADQDKQKQQQQASKAKEDQDKKDQAAAAQKSDDQKDKGDDQQAMVAGQMTKQEAARILDAQQEDEKPLIFTSDDQKKQNPQDGPFKDW